MNNKHQENGALTGPLIFTVPASSFVVILSLDWLDGPAGQLFPPKRTVGSGIGSDGHQRLLEEPGPKDVLRRGVGRCHRGSTFRTVLGDQRVAFYSPSDVTSTLPPVEALAKTYQGPTPPTIGRLRPC
jgi:hypothetical protein